MLEDMEERLLYASSKASKPTELSSQANSSKDQSRFKERASRSRVAYLVHRSSEIVDEAVNVIRLCLGMWIQSKQQSQQILRTEQSQAKGMYQVEVSLREPRSLPFVSLSGNGESVGPCRYREVG